MNNRIILWIEDDKPLEGSISKIEGRFSEFGYDIQWARTGIEAVEYLRNNRYDAVILDIMLEPGSEELKPEGVPPYMGGVEILKLILSDAFAVYNNSKSIPVVVVSAVSDSEIVEKVTGLLGSTSETNYLFKPVSKDIIINTIISAIGKDNE